MIAAADGWEGGGDWHTDPFLVAQLRCLVQVGRGCGLLVGSVQGSRQLAATAQCWGWASAVGCCSHLVLHFTALQPCGPPICVSDPRKLGRITYFYTLVLDLQASWNTKEIPCNCIFVLEYRSLLLCSLRQIDQQDT